jgi:hypothetical protein
MPLLPGRDETNTDEDADADDAMRRLQEETKPETLAADAIAPTRERHGLLGNFM